MAIVTQDDLKYELAISPDNYLIRAYRGWWGANAKLDFCHLFWGTIGMVIIVPLVAIIAAISAPIWVPIRLINQHCRTATPAAPATVTPIEQIKFTTPKRHPHRDKLLKLFVRGGSRVIYVASSGAIWIGERRTFWRMANRAVRIIVLPLAVAGIIVVGGAFGAIVYKCVSLLLTVAPQVWLIIAEAIGGIVLGTAILVLAICLGILSVDRGYHARVGYYASRPAVGSWGLFVMAYRAVKTNTCPRIIIKEE